MTFCIFYFFASPGVFVRLLYVRRELEAGVFLPRAMRLLSGRGGGGAGGGGARGGYMPLSLCWCLQSAPVSERASECEGLG